MLAPDAGPALDALVAQQVFGLMLITATAEATVSWDGGPADRGVWVLYEPLWQQPWGPHVSGPVRPYSTDIAAGWAVFLHAQSQPFSLRQRFWRALQTEADRHLSPETRSRDQHVAYPDVFTVLRDEMPRAFCRAALAALGRVAPVEAPDA